MQQGYIVIHNYPSLSVILVKYIIIDSHTKIEMFQTYVLYCFFFFFTYIEFYF